MTGRPIIFWYTSLLRASTLIELGSALLLLCEVKASWKKLYTREGPTTVAKEQLC